jgi:F-type H+-transporting ATPase subunit a
MEFDISGARIFWRIPTGIPILGDILITETLVVSWIVMAIITGLCIFLTRNLKVEKISKRQAVAELLVESATNLVK